MTIHVPLTPPLEQLLNDQLATGRFQNASDVVAAALRLLDERNRTVDVATDIAFGLWKGRVLDGLSYEQRLRAEWNQ
jgi:putative addiction module CopG family antidote